MRSERSGKQPEQRRWGLRSLLFLALAAASLLFYDVLQANGLALLTTVGLLVGLVGAPVGGTRGIRQRGSRGLPRSCPPGRGSRPQPLTAPAVRPRTK